MTPENENIETCADCTLDPETTTPGVLPKEETQEPETTTLGVLPEDETQEPEMLSGVVVDCVKLNVRTAPNTDAPVVCTIPRGTEVIVTEDESTDEFYKVYTASGVEGFCMAKYINI